MWQQWINALLGLWVIAIPFIGIGGSALTWALAITGIVIAILGVWGAQAEQTIEEELHELQVQHQ